MHVYTTSVVYVYTLCIRYTRLDDVNCDWRRDQSLFDTYSVAIAQYPSSESPQPSLPAIQTFLRRSRYGSIITSLPNPRRRCFVWRRADTSQGPMAYNSQVD